MAIEKFVEMGSIDPMYFDGSYYLAPDGDAVQGVYAVLRQAISETGRVALARIVVGQRERTIGERSAAGGFIAHTPDEQRTSTMQDQPGVIPAVKEEPRASGVIHDDSDAQRADKAEACCRCLRCQTRPQAGVGWGLIWVQPSNQTYLATTFIKAYFAEQLIVGGKVAKLERAHADTRDSGNANLPAAWRTSSRKGRPVYGCQPESGKAFAAMPWGQPVFTGGIARLCLVNPGWTGCLSRCTAASTALYGEETPPQTDRFPHTNRRFASAVRRKIR